MATCTAVAGFLQQLSDRSITVPLPPSDLGDLEQRGLIRTLSAADVQGIQERVATMEAAQAAAAQEAAQRAAAAAQLEADTRKSHSILFHLEGVDERTALLGRLQQEGDALKVLDDDLGRRQQDFAQLLLDRATLDAATPFGSASLSLTTQGRVALRDLNSRLYRVGDTAFGTYWQESARIDDELVTIAEQSRTIQAPLTAKLEEVDRGYLWAIAIGMVKAGGDPATRVQRFIDAFDVLDNVSDNEENVLMAAEIVSIAAPPGPDACESVAALNDQIVQLGVSDQAALGVAAILYLGRRADGTYATSQLSAFLAQTPSIEAAALLAVQNVDPSVLMTKFSTIKSMFGSWGYSPSEDTELSAAYLAVSDLPTDAVAPKLPILARGLGTYLQYPLVGAAILSTIPVLEANETLSLVEKAYEILGQRTGPLAPAELVTLAVRMIHGIDVRTVNELDPTARVPPPPSGPSFSYAASPPRLWVPIMIGHYSYYSTFSGIGGFHPGHVHAWGGGGFTG